LLNPSLSLEMGIPIGVSVGGSSFALPVLLGFWAVHCGSAPGPVFASAGVSPDGRLEPVSGLRPKAEGWVREVGEGWAAVLLPGQEEEIAPLMDRFRPIHRVETVHELAHLVMSWGWLAPHERPPDVLQIERTVRRVAQWQERDKTVMAFLTAHSLGPHRRAMTRRQEVLWLGEMHYLHSCFGRFREGLAFLVEMRAALDAAPDALGADEWAVHAARAAIQLYDAHRFGEAEGLLRPLVEGAGQAQRISAAARAKVLGALGQVCTALGRWDQGFCVLQEAAEIFKYVDPLEISRALHYAIHNRLRAGDLERAEALMDESERWFEETDVYGGCFRAFYRTELDRRGGRTSPRPKIDEGYRGLKHPYAFALQSWARNPFHAAEPRADAIGEAARVLEGVPNGDGVLGFLALTYRLYEAALRGERSSLVKRAAAWEQWVERAGGEPFRDRYGRLSTRLARGIPGVEELLDRVPYH
jgi:tetratricopeptide (TPR) repeat protein